MMKTFRQDLKEAVEKHYNEFHDGSRYWEMKKEFDSIVIFSTLSRTRKCYFSAGLLGISYKTFQRMLLGLPHGKFKKRRRYGKSATKMD